MLIHQIATPACKHPSRFADPTTLIAKTLGDQTMRYIALWALGVPIMGIVVMKLLGII
jgi:hypothetical protein